MMDILISLDKVRNKTILKTIVMEFARQRDEYTCQNCGATTSLHVHHKDGNHWHNDISNVIVLCSLCHRQEHTKMENGTSDMVPEAGMPT